MGWENRKASARRTDGSNGEETGHQRSVDKFCIPILQRQTERERERTPTGNDFISRGALLSPLASYLEL